LLVVEAVRAGSQVVTEEADSAGPDPIGSSYFEPAWTVQRFVTVAPCQLARARKRLVLAGAVLLFPLRSYFVGSAQRECQAAGFAALQNLYFGPLQGCLAPVGPVLLGERGVAEQVEAPVAAPVAAPAMAAEPARNSMYSRLLLPAVPGGISTTRIRARFVAPGPVEPAKI
jgi:hypothetical protein